MKEDKQWCLPDKGYLVLLGLGFLLGRIWLFDINPFAVALFAVMCSERKGEKGMAFAMILGMFTGQDGIMLLKYIMLFSMILFLGHLREKKFSVLLISGLCGGLNLMIGSIHSFFMANTWEMFWLSILESLAILALVNVIQYGVRFILCEEWWKMPGNEELISLLVLVVSAMYGIPRGWDNIFSIVGTLGYLLVLFSGYRFGASTGTIAGAAVGVLSALLGNGMVTIGIYCLLGVIVGTFRQMGRFVSSAAFFVIGCIVICMAESSLIGIMELRGMVSAIIIFLALPKRIVCLIEQEEKMENDDFAKEDVRILANHRIEDFSNAFRKLAKTFEKNRRKEQEISIEEMEEIYEELSERICQDCVNCNYCWGSHYQETSKNLHHILWQMKQEEMGEIAVTSDFGRRCIHLSDFMERGTEKLAVAKMNLGWQNRLAENRELIARQMSEVASALKSFTLDLGDMEDVTVRYGKRIAEELKKHGIRMEGLSVKKRKDKLEVSFQGRCRGNQCLTKTDVAAILSQVLEVKMCPGRETRNVLSHEKETMFFQEDTKFKTLTGVARVAKAGEMVSGDNYSFLNLPTGELLMILADGMGSGESAYQDSGNLIEVLEHLLESGFERKAALRLLNTLFVAKYEGETFATLDMVSLDLYTGKCEIMKNGGAATFIRRKDKVETIYSKALPVGIEIEAESDVATAKLEEGDFIIMVSDGITDSYEGTNSQKELERFMEELPYQNPQDMANQILMNALAKSNRHATDDMSVLVAGMWNKN